MKTNKNNTGGQTPKKSSKKKWLFIGLGVAATGALSYFGWQYWKKKKEERTDAETDSPDFPAEKTSAYSPKPKPKTAAPPPRNDEFPLKKLSKGERVKVLQHYLISKLGKDSLGKSGADGDFGSKTEAALKKAGLATVIDETTFNVLTKVSSPDPKQTATQLYSAATRKDFNTVISLLKTMRNTSDYKAVSDAFSSYRINGVRQTLVNGLLNSFSDEKQKQSIRLAFSTMGLKYDGSKWSLSGLDEKNILISIRATRVWKTPRESVSVPANMVLGKEITRRGKFTLFENDRQLFLIPSADTSYYEK